MRECKGLNGVQRSGCVSPRCSSSRTIRSPRWTSASRCGVPPPPTACAACACPTSTRARATSRCGFIRRCANVWHGSQNACYRWMGMALNVVTNGEFKDDGCSELLFDATRDACKDGAGAYDGPLETFS